MSAAIETRQIPPPLIPEAISRIVASASDPPQDAARRFLANAEAHGIDPALCWGSFDPQSHRVRQACLVVPGSGKTANLFLSPPSEELDEQIQANERRGVLNRVAQDVPKVLADQVRVIQSLPEPEESWACKAFEHSGFTHCGTLSYMRLILSRVSKLEPDPAPERFRIVSVHDLGNLDTWRARMEEALEASYADSLDCPELWGVRETADVLDSHLATGQWDPRLWWMVEDAQAALGVALFNELGDGFGCELVYVGIAPELRGKRLGRALLCKGVAACAGRGLREMTCAVDKRNAPALRLYESLGFREFAQREAFVRRIGSH